MKHRRQAQSSSLSFIDCICCGFGAVLLLFILTAKSQIDQKETDAKQALAAFQMLQDAIANAEEKQKSVEGELASLNPQPDLAEVMGLNQLDTELEIGQLDGQQKRLKARVVPFPHFDPDKERVKGNYGQNQA